MDGLPGFCLSTQVKAPVSQRTLLGVVAMGCLIAGMSAASGRDGSMAPQMSDEGLDAQARSARSVDSEDDVAGEPGHTLCARGVHRSVAGETRGIEHLKDLLGCGLPPDQARIPESGIDHELVDDDVVESGVVDSRVVDSEMADSEAANTLDELESWHRQWGNIPGETTGLAGTGMAGGLAAKRE